MSSTPSDNTESADETLDELLKRLNVSNWDLLLVGDGSGCNWNFECGWGCVSIENATFARRSWHGSMSSGTIGLAEILAYLQPLCWYVDRELKRRKQIKYKTKVRHVHILTDSQYVKNKGSSPDLLAGKSGPLWQMFRQFSSHGIFLHWHWIRRETVELNKFADQLSKAARLNLKGKDLAAEVEMTAFGEPKSVYQFNPSE